MGTINVSSKSSTNELADLILTGLENQSPVSLKAIGAGAVNQAVKGLAAATQRGNKLLAEASFFTVTIEGMEKTGIIMRVVRGEE